MTSKQKKQRLERRHIHAEKVREGSRAGRLVLGTGIGVGAALAVAAPAAAADFTVTNLDASGTGSLANAVAETSTSPGPDRILFQSGLTGTINPEGPMISDGGDLEIVGPGADAITVKGDETFPLFIVGDPVAETPGAFAVSGLALTDGYGQDGAAISATNTDVTVNDSVLTSNSAEVGGAIYAGFLGYPEPGRDGSITVNHSTFSGNSAALGGALASTGDINVTSSTLNRNRGLQGAGAIEMLSSETEDTLLKVEQSTFNRNSSATAGGAIAVFSGPEGISTDLEMSSSTVSGNIAGFIGGGILGGFTNGSISNSIVENNFAYYGPDIYSGVFGGPPPPEPGCGCYGTDFATSFSFIGDTSQALITTTVANSNILNGGDADLGRLADNGGSTETMAVDAESPVVNKGSSPLTVDQRDEKRPVLYPGIPNSTAVGANGADMGAYELQYTAPPPPPPPYRPFLILGSTPNRKKGTATVRVKIPAPGSVRLVGHGIIKSSERTFGSKGVYEFQVVPKGKNIKRRLNKKGRARVLAKFRYTPDEGRVLAKGKSVALFKGNKSKKAKKAALRELRTLDGPGN